jgi:hypothetical protein
MIVFSSSAFATSNINNLGSSLKSTSENERVPKYNFSDEEIESFLHEYLNMIYDYSISPTYEFFEAMFLDGEKDQINFSFEKAKLKRLLMDYYEYKVTNQVISYSNYQSTYNDDGQISATLTVSNEFEILKEKYKSIYNYCFLLQSSENTIQIINVTSDDDVDMSYKNLSDFSAENVINKLRLDDLTKASASPSEINKEQYYLKRQEALKLFADSEYIPYDRARAVSYAKTYCINYNLLFASYKGQGGDCQNFASQCVWYGYGGINTASAINNKLKPMVTGTSNRDWYSTSKLWDCTISWIRCIGFQDYVNNSYGGNPGPAGWIHTGSVAFAEPGDIIQVNWSSGGWHSYIVTAVTGSPGARTKADITVVAHTSDISPTKLSIANSESVSRHITIRIGTYQP